MCGGEHLPPSTLEALSCAFSPSLPPLPTWRSLLWVLLISCDQLNDRQKVPILLLGALLLPEAHRSWGGCERGPGGGNSREVIVRLFALQSGHCAVGDADHGDALPAPHPAGHHHRPHGALPPTPRPICPPQQQHLLPGLRPRLFIATTLCMASGKLEKTHSGSQECRYLALTARICR